MNVQRYCRNFDHPASILGLDAARAGAKLGVDVHRLPWSCKYAPCASPVEHWRAQGSQCNDWISLLRPGASAAPRAAAAPWPRLPPLPDFTRAAPASGQISDWHSMDSFFGAVSDAARRHCDVVITSEDKNAHIMWVEIGPCMMQRWEQLLRQAADRCEFVDVADHDVVKHSLESFDMYAALFVRRRYQDSEEKYSCGVSYCGA